MGQRVVQGDNIGMDWEVLINELGGGVADDVSTASQRKAAEKRDLDPVDEIVENIGTAVMPADVLTRDDATQEISLAADFMKNERR